MIVLRLLAPVLVASTITIFVTGVWLLLLGHQSDTVLFLHQASVIVFAVVFGIHLLAYGLRTIRTLGASLRHDPPRTAGAGLRSMLLTSSLGAGAVLAIAFSAQISSWVGGGPGLH